MTRRVAGHCTVGCGACCRLLSLPYVVGQPQLREGRALVLLAGDVNAQAGDFLRARGVTTWALPAGGTLVRVPIDAHPLPWWQRLEDGQVQTYFQSTCPHLTVANTCGLYGQPERPETCREWPYPQTDLSVVPECTYQIADVTEQEEASV